MLCIHSYNGKNILLKNQFIIPTHYNLFIKCLITFYINYISVFIKIIFKTIRTKLIIILFSKFFYIVILYAVYNI